MCGAPGLDRQAEQQHADDGEHHQLFLPGHAVHDQTVTVRQGFCNLGEMSPSYFSRPFGTLALTVVDMACDSANP